MNADFSPRVFSKFSDDHEHDRYLRVENGFMVFGCINPFCCHGEFGLPILRRVPLETGSVIVKVAAHKGRFVTFELTLKRQIGEHKAGDVVTLRCADNLEDCKVKFGEFFGGGA